MLKRILLLIFVVFVGANSFSQELWSLERCIQYAIDNNIQIKQQALNSEYQKNQLLTSKMSVLPSVNGSGYESLTFGRRVDAYTNDFSTENTQALNMELSARVDLFKGGQKLHEIRKSKLNLEASLKDLDKAKNDISVNIANAFFNVLYNQELLEVTSRQLETTRLQVINTEKLVNAGALANGNLLEIQSQLANEELQLINSQNSLDLAYLTLTQFLELDTVKGFEILIPVLDPINQTSILPAVQQVFNEAVMVMPEIESADLSKSVAREDLSIARASRYPSLSLSAGYGSGYSSARKDLDGITPTSPVLVGYGYNSINDNYFDVYQYGFDYTYKTRAFSDQLKDNASSSISFGLSIPIFNGWQVNSAISNAKINLESARYSSDLARKQLFREIQQASADANAALKKYIATEKALEAMRESFRYTQKKFDVGLVTSLEFNTAKTQLNKTESELLQSKYEFIFKQKILDFYRGKPITISVK